MKVISTKSLVADARVWLRMTTTVHDDEIEQTMDACILDLQNGGVVNIDISDPLIRQALKLYLKAQFGYDTKADRFEKAYEYLKYSLELSSDYNREAVDEG